MNIKNNAVWFWISLALLPITLFLIFRELNSSKKPEPRIENIETENVGDSTHLEYYKLVEAINLRIAGKEKASLQILKELSKSENKDIRKASVRELDKSKIVQIKEIASKHSEPEIEQTEEPKPKHNLRELEFTPKNIETLKTTQTFLNLVSSKGKKFEYLGDIEEEKANGYGIGIYESGSIYKGHWKDNLRHGQGIFTWRDGESYNGGYISDLRHGEGTYIWKNGEKYIGGWKEDKRHGNGRVYKKNGKVKSSGTWANDKLVESIKN